MKEWLYNFYMIKKRKDLMGLLALGALLIAFLIILAGGSFPSVVPTVVPSASAEPAAIVQTIAPATFEPVMPTNTVTAVTAEPTATAKPTATAEPTATATVSPIKTGLYDSRFGMYALDATTQIMPDAIYLDVDERLRPIYNPDQKVIHYNENVTTVIDGITYVQAYADNNENKKFFVELAKIVPVPESDSVLAWNEIMRRHVKIQDNRSFSVVNVYKNTYKLDVRFVSSSKLETTKMCDMDVSYLPIYTYLNGHIVKHGVIVQDITNGVLDTRRIFSPMPSGKLNEDRSYVYNIVEQFQTVIAFTDDTSTNTYLSGPQWVSIYDNIIISDEHIKFFKCLPSSGYYNKFIESKGESFTLFLPAWKLGSSDFIPSDRNTGVVGDELKLIKRIK